MGPRSLTTDEIEQLMEQDCSADSWQNIFVSNNFTPDFCHDVLFSGTIYLGCFGKEISASISISTGIKKYSGIYRAHIHNCTIEDNVYSSSVHGHIANYTIENGAYIENVTTIEVGDNNSFGEGVMVPVLSELKGRAIPIFSGLTAQIAYLMVFYRHRPNLIDNILNLIKIEKLSSGIIGEGAKVINCGIISNIQIGQYSNLEGVERLTNGTINSSKEAPVKIGHGVIADNFIVSQGSSILDRTIIDTCFIGEGSELAKEYSAENSLLFSNFIGHHGEACALFAGPHTATFHKSTLLISAYLSFLNAGSGSNQSNHMYKLGPLHHGIIERGSKTASDSYMLWPARVGLFTLITGRHSDHCDTTDLPYSYLIEENNRTILIPGVNIKSVGTIRDADKWPTRDKRVGKSDIINYDLLSPYSAGKMISGLNILKELSFDNQHRDRMYRYNGVSIPKDALKKGIHYYDIGIMKFIGNILVKRLINNSFKNIDELKELLRPTSKIGLSSWVDLSGMIAPKEFIDLLCEEIELGKFGSIESIREKLEDINSNYNNWSWNWAAKQLEIQLGISIDNFTTETVLQLLDNWIAATEELDHRFLEDAKKEFSIKTQIGFGIDGGKETQLHDFIAVRGTYEDNSFIKKIYSHLANKRALYNRALDKLNSFCE